MVRQLDKIKAKHAVQVQEYKTFNNRANLDLIFQVQKLKGKHFDAGCTCRFD